MKTSHLLALFVGLVGLALLWSPDLATQGALLAVVTCSATLKTNRMQLIPDLIDGKSAAASTGGTSAGKLVIGTSALSGGTGVLATINLPVPSFTESGGVITLQGVPLSATASASGTAAKAELRTNGGTVIVSGLTVGTSGTDIIIDSVSITLGETVGITAGTITHG